MKRVMTLMLGLSFLAYAGFYRNDSRGIVTDSTTTLQWQDDYGNDNPNIREVEWTGAISYCENLTLGGYIDWRLPNINELSTIDMFTQASPTISNVFAYKNGYSYWASSTYAANSDYAWIVNFNDGSQYYGSKSSNNYVRCVRAG